MAASSPSIYLATPCYGGQAHAAYMRSVLALRSACGARGVELQFDISSGEALIGRGRALLLAKFLASAATHLMFVDADIAFEPSALFRLMDAGLDVVGGVYPRKAPRDGNELDELPPGASRTLDGFRTVAAVGAGFLLVSRAAAVRLAAAYPQLRANLSDFQGAEISEAVMVFDSLIDPDTGRYLADHQAFCRRWRDIGGEVWAAGASDLVHVGAARTSVPAASPSPGRIDRPTAQALWRQAEADVSEGRLPDAEQILRRMIEGGAAGPDVQYLLGFVLLARGEYQEGFKRYEARRRVPAFRIATPPIPCPPWRGEPLAGKRLLIWPEQGFGDQIMFSRFALRLADAGARVTMAAPAALARMFAGTPVEILPLAGSLMLSGYDHHVLAGDLPLHCGADLATVPPPWPLKGLAPSSPRGTGIMTAGDPSHPNDANRSLPPDLAARLLALPGAVSLRPEDTGAGDFQDTADIIAGLERVITVDTAVAHLAGSMGVPTTVLVPNRRTDWRWLQHRTDSPWYPSVTLARQPAVGWSEVVERLVETAAPR